MGEEDPTFMVHDDPETGQTILRGMGELHLEIVCDRLQREFNVPVNVGKPQVVYRETLLRTAEASESFERSFDENVKMKNMYAGMILEAGPAPRGSGISFQNDWKQPDSLSSSSYQEWLRSAEEGVREAAGSGPKTGYPMVDVAIRLKSLDYRDGETTPISVHIVAASTFRLVSQKAQTAVLLPVMSLEVTVPDEFTGTVIGDVNARSGRVEKVEKRATRTLVHARVPMTKMFGYATNLRSLTEGRGTFTMSFLLFDAM